jgi:outer membrane protein OmpA-like peptidoglycan-associated protein
VFGAEDTDKDGVSDKKDVCPEVPGLKEFDGCPDTDGDGIPDNKDACPEEAGSAELNGCPDTDGDGIADKDDACPEAVGSVEMNGCPDTDGDGVADNLDKCPDAAGDVANNGCPWDDRDGDGVADKDDTCPDEVGDVANNGCPEVPEKLVAFLDSENSTLLFVVDSSLITELSADKLKELNTLLNDYPNANIVIEGHASSDGSMNYNQKLSEKRANSVKEVLVGMGIDASRLETAAFGETRPAADNKTFAGRSANRRVEFDRKVEIKVVE